METAFIVATVLLVLFALTALYDGFYLHIVKYRLYEHRESKGEHLTHTIRAVLFPFILYFLYLQTTSLSFYIGMTIIGIDLLVMAIDAFMEKDSRRFMGGLPRWEYILHLFVNGFHFASIAVFIIIKVGITTEGMLLIRDVSQNENYSVFGWIVINLLPGAVVMALLHILVSIPVTAFLWNKIRSKVSCC